MFHIIRRVESILPPEREVYVNIYDLHKRNECMKKVGFGFYHSAVEAYGYEFAFAGHPFEFSGIFALTPRSFEQKYPLREKKFMGHSNYDFKTVSQYLERLGATEFSGQKYDLVRNNCNHFTRKFVKYLCNVKIPRYVNRMTLFGYICCVPTTKALELSEEEERIYKPLLQAMVFKSTY